MLKWRANPWNVGSLTMGIMDSPNMDASSSPSTPPLAEDASRGRFIGKRDKDREAVEEVIVAVSKTSSSSSDVGYRRPGSRSSGPRLDDIEMSERRHHDSLDEEPPQDDGDAEKRRKRRRRNKPSAPVVHRRHRSPASSDSDHNCGKSKDRRRRGSPDLCPMDDPSPCQQPPPELSSATSEPHLPRIHSQKYSTLEHQRIISRAAPKYQANGFIQGIGDDIKPAAGMNQNGVTSVLMRPLDLDTMVPNGGIVGSSGAKELEASPINAVEARGVYKSYGQRGNAVHVLKGLNLTVPQGAIYGLLGPSGCGKTTLLKCIVGRLSVKSGYIKVFGEYPGTRRSGIPGHRVGYMPQDIALFNEFTIQETLEYFGRIYDMHKTDVQRRMFFLLEFLHLPKPTRFVKNLSGGQKRRVSFAVALLKEPPLLILDEPTVGVDPLLRQSIWEHLVTISRGGNTTIIITTHYIEEARQAHVVGLMRNGGLLAEDAPENLLVTHNLPSLEDVFLKLCLTAKGGAEDGGIQRGMVVHQNGVSKTVGENPLTVASNGSIYPISSSTEALLKEDRKRKKDSCCSCHMSYNKVAALFIKNMIKLWRNLGYLGFQFLLPSLQIILFCLAIGRDPMGLNMAVVNHEGVHNDSLNFGKMFLDLLDHDCITQIDYELMPDAIKSVKDGYTWGVIEIPKNFSQDLISRVYQGPAAEDAVIDGSTISIYLDSTNQQIAYTVREKVLLGFQEFSIQQMNASGSNPKLGQIPINFGDPIYGTKDPNFTEFMAPGIILSVSYFMAVGLTALTFVLERKEGLLDRTWVAGVNTTELMVGHFISQFFVMVVQIALSLLFMIVAFQVPCRGPALWVILLTMAQGICGMAYGLVISSFCVEENSAIMIALGSFFPSLLLSGIIWPVEGMPEYLRYVAYFVPQTYATEALRALLSRGWGIAYMVVWRGFVVTLAWFFIFFVIAGIIFRIRR